MILDVILWPMTAASTAGQSPWTFYLDNCAVSDFFSISPKSGTIFNLYRVLLLLKNSPRKFILSPVHLEIQLIDDNGWFVGSNFGCWPSV